MFDRRNIESCMYAALQHFTFFTNMSQMFFANIGSRYSCTHKHHCLVHCALNSILETSQIFWDNKVHAKYWSYTSDNGDVWIVYLLIDIVLHITYIHFYFLPEASSELSVDLCPSSQIYRELNIQSLLILVIYLNIDGILQIRRFLRHSELITPVTVELE